MFFNVATTDCDKSTFHYHWAAYNPPSDWPLNRIVYLTQELRVELDDLVTDLNNVTQAAISEANTANGGEPQIHFVDLNQRFDTHRWCEQGDWHEPAPNVQSTWFFLSAWPDVSIENASVDNATLIDNAAVESSEISNIINTGGIPMPKPGCLNTTEPNQDPYIRNLCYLAETIAQVPDGLLAKEYANALADIKDRNFTSQHIGYFSPTRQIKTFHPRSPGMKAYQDAIMVSMDMLV
jgi:hypothetical protein